MTIEELKQKVQNASSRILINHNLEETMKQIGVTVNDYGTCSINKCPTGEQAFHIMFTKNNLPVIIYLTENSTTWNI